MSTRLDHGRRRFEVLAYHDAIHDGWAVELAELTSDGLGPALITVVFADDASANARVLLDRGELPLAVLTDFLAEVAQEQRRTGGAPDLPG